jgi:hypothetical protein
MGMKLSNGYQNATTKSKQCKPNKINVDQQMNLLDSALGIR